MYICKKYSYINKNGIFMRLCELRQKEIINTCTCKSLGCPIDLEFDCATGRIHSLIVPGPGKFCSFFGRENEYIIPWNCICQIAPCLGWSRLTGPGGGDGRTGLPA